MKTTIVQTTISINDQEGKLSNAVTVNVNNTLDHLVALTAFLGVELTADQQEKLAGLLRDARQLRFAKRVHKVGAEQIGLVFDDRVFISVSNVTKNHKI